MNTNKKTKNNKVNKAIDNMENIISSNSENVKDNDNDNDNNNNYKKGKKFLS